MRGTLTGKMGLIAFEAKGSLARKSRRVAAYALTLRKHRSKMVETTTIKTLPRSPRGTSTKLKLFKDIVYKFFDSDGTLKGSRESKLTNSPRLILSKIADGMAGIV